MCDETYIFNSNKSFAIFRPALRAGAVQLESTLREEGAFSALV